MTTTKPIARASAVTLVFQTTEFDIVDLQGQPWLRGAQAALALGYKNPENAIKDLYSRNADEFTSEMTQVLELPSAGGPQATRIFSLRGAHLLGMLARTERAAAFRRWVLDVLEGREAPQQAGPMSYAQRLAYLKERSTLVARLRKARNRAEAQELHQNLCQVSRLVGIEAQALEQLAPEALKPPPKKLVAPGRGHEPWGDQ